LIISPNCFFCRYGFLYLNCCGNFDASITVIFDTDSNPQPLRGLDLVHRRKSSLARSSDPSVLRPAHAFLQAAILHSLHSLVPALRSARWSSSPIAIALFELSLPFLMGACCPARCVLPVCKGTCIDTPSGPSSTASTVSANSAVLTLYCSQVLPGCSWDFPWPPAKTPFDINPDSN
jgi:hypothetical protein